MKEKEIVNELAEKAYGLCPEAFSSASAAKDWAEAVVDFYPAWALANPDGIEEDLESLSYETYEGPKSGKITVEFKFRGGTFDSWEIK